MLLGGRPGERKLPGALAQALGYEAHANGGRVKDGARRPASRIASIIPNQPAKLRTPHRLAAPVPRRLRIRQSPPSGVSDHTVGAHHPVIRGSAGPSKGHAQAHGIAHILVSALRNNLGTYSSSVRKPAESLDFWRSGRESNPHSRICSPLHHHSATGPSVYGGPLSPGRRRWSSAGMSV